MFQCNVCHTFSASIYIFNVREPQPIKSFKILLARLIINTSIADLCSRYRRTPTNKNVKISVQSYTFGQPCKLSWTKRSMKKLHFVFKMDAQQMCAYDLRTELEKRGLVSDGSVQELRDRLRADIGEFLS